LRAISSSKERPISPKIKLPEAMIPRNIWWIDFRKGNANAADAQSVASIVVVLPAKLALVGVDFAGEVGVQLKWCFGPKSIFGQGFVGARPIGDR